MSTTRNTVFDFRDNRVHYRLIDVYAAKLGVPHLNAYPVFNGSKGDDYGETDQHFSAKGYARYGRFLFRSIEADVRAALRAP